MRKFNLFACLILLLSPIGAMAQGAALDPFNLTARYEFAWNNVPLGKVAIEVEETATQYSMHAMVKSLGVVSLFAKHTSDTVMEGNKANGQYFSKSYETNLTTRKKSKHIKIDYDGAGKITDELSEPPDSDRPKVPQAEKEKAADLLTSVFFIRKYLHDAINEKASQYDFDMYDGRKLTHLHFEIVGREKRSVRNKSRSVVHVVASREPGAGYTEKELKKMKDEPALHLYFSDDAKLIPLAMQVDHYGPITGTLVKQCGDISECF